MKLVAGLEYETPIKMWLSLTNICSIAWLLVKEALKEIWKVVLDIQHDGVLTEIDDFTSSFFRFAVQLMILSKIKNQQFW